MSGGASIPFAALAVFLDNKWAQVIFAATALCCAWFAAYRVWKPERQKVCDLQERLAPKIVITVGPVHTEETLNNNGVRGLSKWLQLIIGTATDAPLLNCEVWVTEVKRVEDSKVL